MDYKVVVTAEAEEDLNQFIQYLLFAKKNKHHDARAGGRHCHFHSGHGVCRADACADEYTA